MILEAFDNAYLNALSDEVVGYANCRSLDLLTHLLTFYAMIAPTELTQNCERLNTPYDPNQPIKTLFQQIQDARAFAVAGGHPYGAAMIVNVAYTLVFNTGLYPDACRAWQSRAIAAKTWAQILDSGCTSNFLSAAARCSDKHAAHVPLNVNMPNGMTIQLSHTCNLLLTDLPHQAQQAHILPGLVHNSLISVGQLCDNECSFTFTQDQVTVSRNGKDVMYGSRDPKSRLWRVNLNQKMKSCT
jgi:hypothetical protein